MISVCFVCLGNICRSPTAEGVMLHLLEEADLADRVRVDSAGTAGYHIGKGPDPRTVRAATRRGVHLPSRAWQFQSKDFDRFDYVICMDNSNLEDLKELATPAQRKKLHLLMDFDPETPKGGSVPDPYYGGEAGFEVVLDLCFSACRGLLSHWLENNLLRTQKMES